MERNHCDNAGCYKGEMAKKQFRRTYIREWRNKRGLSLRKLAQRIESEPGVELISFASIGRIENGKQPYTQPVIEAIAAALDVTVAMLVEVNPEVDGEIIDLVRHMDRDKRETAVRMLKALAS